MSIHKPIDAASPVNSQARLPVPPIQVASPMAGQPAAMMNGDFGVSAQLLALRHPIRAPAPINCRL
jgi:hypothetical protein